MWWLNNTKIPYNASDLYVEVEKFKEFCKELNVDITYLDTYEKYKLVYPVYRIFRPKEYLQTIFEQQYNNPEQIYNIPDNYIKLFELEHRMLPAWQLYRGAKLWNLINKGHPLDQAYKENNPFVRKLDANSFIPRWKYKVTLRKDGEDYAVKDFYSPWQIYLLEEANQNFVRSVNILKNFEEYRFHWNPLSLKLAQINQESLSLTKWQDFFIAIWDYRFKENAVLSHFTPNQSGFFILEGKEAENFYNERKKIAKTIAPRFSYSQWIEFLKQLCVLYYQYKKHEKIKLSECIKEDIRTVIDILMLGFNKKYRKIIEDVGHIYNQKTKYIPALEEIFPEWKTFLKREAKFYLESIMKNYNREMPSRYRINQNELDQIIDYTFKINNEILLISIIGINKEYFWPSHFGREGLWPYLTSLVLAVEVWIKKLADKKKLDKALKSLTENNFQVGYECFRKLYKTEYNETLPGYPSSINLIKCSKLLQKFYCTKGKRDISWIKYLVFAYLIRNYVAHNTKVDPSLFGTPLITFYRVLIYLIFYAWKSKNP